MRRLFVFAALALFGACTVPSLSDVEKDGLKKCDDAHPCVSGYSCGADGFCHPASGGGGGTGGGVGGGAGGGGGGGGTTSCTPSTTQSCGITKGECRAGVETCQDDGGWGSCIGEVGPVAEVCDGKDNNCNGTIDDNALTSSCGVDAGVCAGKNRACQSGVEEATCTAASYGPDYETTETRCDGLDNDCDGLTDESLFAACALTAGVCAGATQACTNGSYPGCTTSDYLANSAAYESYEYLCDNKDNDCDGLSDQWNERLVSDAGSGIVRRAVVAVPIPDAGVGIAHDILTFYEDGNRVVMRPVRANGGPQATTFPAQSVAVANRAWSPAIASDGTTMAAAWFDEIGSGTLTDRLEVGLPRADGQSFISGVAGASPITTVPGTGSSISLTAAGGRIAIAYDYLDSSSILRVAIANCPIDLGTSCGTKLVTTGSQSGRRPRVALNATGDVMLVTFDTIAGYTSPMFVGQYSGTTTLTVVGGVAFGGSGEHSPVPVIVGTNAAAVYDIDDTAAQVGFHSCSIGVAGGCSPSGAFTNVFTVPSNASADNLNVIPSGTDALLTAESVAGGLSSVLVKRYPSGATRTTISTGSNLFRPWAVRLNTSSTPAVAVFYDTEGTTDAVYEQRLCGL